MEVHLSMSAAEGCKFIFQASTAGSIAHSAKWGTGGCMPGTVARCDTCANLSRTICREQRDVKLGVHA